MQIPLKQLNAHLKNKLAGVYLVSGDVPLLIRETRLAIQEAAKKAGYLRRELLQVQNGFDWSKFISLTKNHGLFGDKSIIEILNPNAKFDNAATNILIDYLHSNHDDHVLVIVTNKLTMAQKKARWYKAINDAGMTIPIWPITIAELPQWIVNECQKFQLMIDQDSIKLLAELTEGNLLATSQAIEKIRLLFPKQKITRQEILVAISDNARFNVFDLTHYLLAGQLKRATRILNGLNHEGTEPTLILWALTKEIRQLISMKEKIEQGMPMGQVLEKIWFNQKKMYQQALTRISMAQLNDCLQLANHIDQMIKGAKSGNAWDHLLQLCIAFCHDKLFKRNDYVYC